MFDNSFSHITADAATPEQIVPYVLAVSGRKALGCGPFAAYVHDGHGVLAAFPGLAGSGGCAAWAGRAAALAALSSGAATGEQTGGAAAEQTGVAAAEQAGAAAAEHAGVDAAPAASGAYGASGAGRCNTPEARHMLADVSPDPAFAAAVEQCIAALPESITRLTVMAPFRPAGAPDTAASLVDCYWTLPVPHFPAGQKLRNMLTRAAKDVRLEVEEFSAEHRALVGQYLSGRPLGPGTRSIFSSLGAYLAAPGAKALLLAARDGAGRLAAFSIGEYASLHTAQYMFSFRQSLAPPGTADLLLQGLLEHAALCGHSRMNLGLGISGGIRGFKKKWQAVPGLPYVETTWERSARRTGLLAGWLNRITGR